MHLLVRKEAFDSTTGILSKAEDSVIILRKWYGHWLLGTTDTPYDGDKSNPVAEKEDIDYLLRNVNTLLRRKIERADLLGTYAGLRPLLAPAGADAKSTSALSRDHAVIEAPTGMVTIVGGKYTTYRPMARDAVDAAARSLGREIPPTPTENLPLVGAPGWQVIRNQLPGLSARYGVPEPTLQRMLHRYGAELPDVLAPIAGDPALGRPIDHTAGYLPVEFRLRGHQGGRADPGRRAHPPHPRRDRGPGRRGRRGRGGGRPDRAGAGVGRGTAEGGGRGLRGPAAARDHPLNFSHVGGGWCPLRHHPPPTVFPCSGLLCACLGGQHVVADLVRGSGTASRRTASWVAHATRSGRSIALPADVALHDLAGRVAVLVEHRRVDAVVGAAQVVAAPGGERQHRRQHQGQHDGHQRRERLERRAERRRRTRRWRRRPR